MSAIITQCKAFLDQDFAKFQNPNFKHAQYIVELLAEYKDNQLVKKFEELEELEKKCDELVTSIVEDKHEELENLAKNPNFYGEHYEKMRKLITNSRKKIRRSKESLTLRQANLQGFYYNSLNNKEVLKVLEKVDECFEKLVEIDILMKSNSIFEATICTLQLRLKLKDLNTNFNSCIVVKNLVNSEQIKTREICQLCVKHLRSYFYYIQSEFSAKMLKNTLNNSKTSEFKIERVDLTDQVSEQKKLAALASDNIDKILTMSYGINIESLTLLEIKLGFIKMVVNSKPKNYVYESDAEYESLASSETLDNMQLVRFINYSFDMNALLSFNTFIEADHSVAEEDASISSGQDLDMLNLYFVCKSAEMLNASHILVNDFFINMRKEIHDTFLMQMMSFLRELHKMQKEKAHEQTLAGFLSMEETASTQNEDFSSLWADLESNDQEEEKTLKNQNLDLFEVSKYDKGNMKLITNFMKQLVVYSSIFIKKSTLLALLLRRNQKGLSKSTLFSLKDIWRFYVFEIDCLLERVLQLKKIDLRKMKNPDENASIFEKFDPKIRGSARKNEILASLESNQHVEQFLYSKVGQMLDLNFLYLPFLIRVLYKPMILISQHICVIEEKTNLKKFYDEILGVETQGDIIGEVIKMLEGHLQRFIGFFKLEYLKYFEENIGDPQRGSFISQKTVSGFKDTFDEYRAGPLPFKSPVAKNIQKNEPTRPGRFANQQPNQERSTSADSKLLGFKDIMFQIPAYAFAAPNLVLLAKLANVFPLESVSHFLDLQVWTMHTLLKESEKSFERIIAGTFSEMVLKQYDLNKLRQGMGYVRFKQGILMRTGCFSMTNETFAEKNIPKYRRELKSFYAKVFNSSITVGENQMVSRMENIIQIAGIIDNLEVFLRTARTTYLKILQRLPVNVLANLIQSKQDSSQNDDIKLENMLHFSQNDKDLKPVLESLKNALKDGFKPDAMSQFDINIDSIVGTHNLFRMVFENKAESSVIAIKKLLLRYLSLIDTCFLTLKIEVHARCFAYLLRAPKESSFFMENQSKELSVHNFSSFYRETFLLYESLRDAISPDKLACIYDDMIYITCKSIGANFLKKGRVSKVFGKILVQSISGLETNLKRLEIRDEIVTKENNFDKIKRFVSVFFMEFNEVIAFLKTQPQKFSEKKLKIFIEQRTALTVKNEEFMAKLQELVEKVQPYLKRKAPPKDQQVLTKDANQVPKEESKSKK